MAIVWEQDACLRLSWGHAEAGLAAISKLAFDERTDVYSHTDCIRAPF